MSSAVGMVWAEVVMGAAIFVFYTRVGIYLKINILILQVSIEFYLYWVELSILYSLCSIKILIPVEQKISITLIQGKKGEENPHPKNSIAFYTPVFIKLNKLVILLPFLFIYLVQLQQMTLDQVYNKTF